MFSIPEEHKAKKASLKAKLKAEYDLCYEAFVLERSMSHLKMLSRCAALVVTFYETIHEAEKDLLRTATASREKSYEDIAWLKAEMLIDEANIMAIAFQMKNVLDNTTLM